MAKKKSKFLSLFSKKNENLEDNEEYDVEQVTSQEIAYRNRSPIQYVRNPIYDIVKSSSENRQELDEKVKHAEDVKTVSSLVNVVKAIGRGVSAFSGAKVADISTDVFDKANKYLDLVNKIEDDESDKNNEKATRNIFGEKEVKQPAFVHRTGKSLKELPENEYRDSLRQRFKDGSDDSYADKAKEIAAGNKKYLSDVSKINSGNMSYLEDQLEGHYRSKERAVRSSKKGNGPELVTYVKYNGRTIPIYEDEMADIYRLANFNNLLVPYRYERDSKGRAYQLAAAAGQVFDKYGEEEVLSGRAVLKLKETNAMNPFYNNSDNY